MDFIKQNKFISFVIAILIALNVLTLSIIWIQSERKNQPAIKEPGNQPPGSVKLMQREIGLSDEQANNFEEMQKDLKASTKKLNDELDSP